MVLQEYVDFRTLKRERVAISSREPYGFLCTQPPRFSAGSCFTVSNSQLPAQLHGEESLRLCAQRIFVYELTVSQQCNLHWP